MVFDVNRANRKRMMRWTLLPLSSLLLLFLLPLLVPLFFNHYSFNWAYGCCTCTSFQVFFFSIQIFCFCFPLFLLLFLYCALIWRMEINVLHSIILVSKLSKLKKEGLWYGNTKAGSKKRVELRGESCCSHMIKHWTIVHCIISWPIRMFLRL